jgi:pilus assembly protein CpaF
VGPTHGRSDLGTLGHRALTPWETSVRTSSGKTSLLNALVGGVLGGAGRRTDHERIITLEDTAELQLDAAHVLRLETRPATVDGTPAITMTDLVRTALRLRPDRLVLGEIRGAEVVDMLAAMNTGHSGSLSTCHANSTLDALRRVESLVVQHSPSWPLMAVRDTVHASLDVVVHVERRADGRREVNDVLELMAPGSSGGHRALVTNGHVSGELLRSRT